MNEHTIDSNGRERLMAQLLAGEFPDQYGRYGPFGGRYVPETLVPAHERLEQGVHLALLVVEFGLPQQGQVFNVVLGEDLLVFLPVGAPDVASIRQPVRSVGEKSTGGETQQQELGGAGSLLDHDGWFKLHTIHQMPSGLAEVSHGRNLCGRFGFVYD